MPQLSFKIPRSLASYLEQYEDNPEKTVIRLKRQLKKRGPDAVGYFLLGWLYHMQGAQKAAVDCALKAKILAPGSPFFKKLPYYFSHPDLFDAWHTSASYSNATKSNTNVHSVPSLNLDSLIEKLSQIDTTRTKNKSEFTRKSDDSITHDYKEVNDIVTETLAKVHEQQGKTGAAIRVYQKLKKINKNRAEYYDKRIVELKEDENTAD